jgi:hypothetical protein
MTRITRMLATRLRRIASPPRATMTARTSASEAWLRLDQALATTTLAPHDVRRREWIQEGTRLSITLIGQQGRGAIARVLAACDGNISEAGDAVRIALSVGATLGHTA